jgi:type IX secretion system PorP/SprF family membrane protein
MKRILFIFLFIACYAGIFAQQDPQFTQYMFNKTLFNPASTGVSEAICLTGFGRDQWIGFQDENGNSVNPQSYGLSFDMPVYTIKSGVGLTFLYDKLGYEKNINVKLNYSYHLTFHKVHMLSFGLSLGLMNKSIDFSKLQPSGEDPLIQSNSVEKGTVTDVGFGAHYEAFDKFEAGFSVTNLIGTKAEIGGPEFTLSRHYYLYSEYDFELKTKGNYKLVLTPGFLFKATSAAASLDINAILTYNDLLWGGVTYRLENALCLLAGVNIKGLQIGLSYDYKLGSDFAKGYRSSVEFVVKYCYPIYPPVLKKSGYNIRNL